VGTLTSLKIKLLKWWSLELLKDHPNHSLYMLVVDGLEVNVNRTIFF